MRIKLGELGIKHMYRFYCTTTAEPVEYKVYKKVVESYIEKNMKLIIYEGYNFKLYSLLGNFRIQKTEINYNKLALDMGHYQKTGDKLYHLNTHSDGYKVKFLWEKKKVILKANAKRPYSFTLSRDWKRKLAQVMKTKNGHSIYAEEIIPT